MTRTYRNWTDEELVEACKISSSFAQVIRTIGLIPAGGNYKSIQKHITRLNIDTSHFSGKVWSRGMNLGPRKPIDEYLVYGYTSSDRLRRRLLSEGLKVACCEECGLSEWLGKPISLELDHKDGDHLNNILGNLRLLCPNCHAQTETYRGKNIKASVV